MTHQASTEEVPTPALSDWAADKDPRLTPYGATNLGSSLDLVDGLITPTRLFFVRSNYSVPLLDRERWRLRVEGLVERPLRLSLGELEAMPQRSLVAFLECSGNGRTRYDPPAEGTPWREDAVGNAEWAGVPLAHVLDLAGVWPEAIELVSQGGDSPEMRRGLPLDAGRDPDAMIVLRMNGEELAPAHGGPARLLIPGWGGIASTKWLVGLELIDRRFEGFWNAENYLLLDADGAETGRVEWMPVKSVIATPVQGARRAAGEVVVAGYAWSGHGAIERVEVSTDGGETYSEAPIVDEAGPHSWVRFEHRWDARPGAHRLRSRAVDAAGNVQPESARWNAKGYQMNAIYEVAVTIA